jgi:hypothetical protein
MFKEFLTRKLLLPRISSLTRREIIKAHVIRVFYVDSAIFRAEFTSWRNSVLDKLLFQRGIWWGMEQDIRTGNNDICIKIILWRYFKLLIPRSFIFIFPTWSKQLFSFQYAPVILCTLIVRNKMPFVRIS